MNVTQLLHVLKEQLQSLYGNRLRGLVLYGSAARGQSGPDSDIDILCILDGPLSGREISDIVDATYDLQLRNPDLIFHIVPAEYEHYRTGAYALCRSVHREGIAI